MDITKNVKRIIAEVLGIEEEELNMTDEIEYVDKWDSVNSLRILTNLEDEYKIKISFKDYQKVTTVEEIVAIVKKGL